MFSGYPTEAVNDNETITVSNADVVTPDALGVNNEAITVADSVQIQELGIDTTTKLAISPSLVSTGQSVTFTATDTQAAGTATPSGSVTFSCAQPSLNSDPIILSAAGMANWTTSSVPVGIYNNCITAACSGDASYAPSVSPRGSLTVINIRYEVPPPADVILWPG